MLNPLLPGRKWARCVRKGTGESFSLPDSSEGHCHCKVFSGWGLGLGGCRLSHQNLNFLSFSGQVAALACREGQALPGGAWMRPQEAPWFADRLGAVLLTSRSEGGCSPLLLGLPRKSLTYVTAVAAGTDHDLLRPSMRGCSSCPAPFPRWAAHASCSQPFDTCIGSTNETPSLVCLQDSCQGYTACPGCLKLLPGGHWE